MPAKTDHEPRVGDMRRTMPQPLRRRSLLRAMLVLIPTIAIYFGALAATMLAPWWLMPIGSLLVGTVAGVLFVISHDAAHNAFTPYRFLNGVIARLCFIPAWHAYTGWVHAHNHVHHGWTNLRTKDYVWSPLTKAEYDGRSRWQRAAVRLYRSGFGFAAYYLYEVVFRKIFLLQPEIHHRKVRIAWILDDGLLLVGIAMQAWAIVATHRAWQGTTSVAWLLAVTIVIPAVMANFWIGFITYLQHTHPLIPWFDCVDEWSFYMGQVRGTTHTHFQYHINSLIHNVMEHTAHHVDPHIPLYHLPTAQAKLETAYPGDVVQHRFSFRSLRRTLRVCQLYDFEKHCWQSFSGEPTSSRTVDLGTVQASRDNHDRPSSEAE